VEAAELRARCVLENEMKQMRGVHAFLVTTPTGKIHEELERGRQPERRLHQLVSTMSRSTGAAKLDEEEVEGKEMVESSMKRARIDETKHNETEEESSIEGEEEEREKLEDGELVED
ncbi:hypothetical protein PMAYCL1PPCAC_26828, partial [Pristionchus mayeri]